MTRTIALPKLGKLYRRAALDAVKSRLTSNGSLKALPREPVLAVHPGISSEQVEHYRKLFNGESFDGAHRRSLPSVLVHTAAFPVQMALMGQDDFPLPLMGMVHLSNAVRHHKPVESGQPLQVLAWAQNLRPHRRGTQAEIVVEIYPEHVDTESAGEADLLWSSVSTYLGRGTYVFGKDDDAPAPPREEFTPPPKTALWTLGADAGREYAAVSGDYNPIHVSGLAAKALGMPTTIVHGMYSAGRMLEGREPEGAGHRWNITFEAPVALPGRVAFAVERPDEKTQHFTGWNPRKGRRHFTGELSIP